MIYKFSLIMLTIFITRNIQFVDFTIGFWAKTAKTPAVLRRQKYPRFVFKETQPLFAQRSRSFIHDKNNPNAKVFQNVYCLVVLLHRYPKFLLVSSKNSALWWYFQKINISIEFISQFTCLLVVVWHKNRVDQICFIWFFILEENVTC